MASIESVLESWFSHILAGTFCLLDWDPRHKINLWRPGDHLGAILLVRWNMLYNILRHIYEEGFNIFDILSHSLLQTWRFIFLKFLLQGMLELKEGFLQCQTPTSSIRFKEEVWRVKEWRMESEGWRFNDEG